MTDISENITFLQLCLQLVKIRYAILSLALFYFLRHVNLFISAHCNISCGGIFKLVSCSEMSADDSVTFLLLQYHSKMEDEIQLLSDYLTKTIEKDFNSYIIASRLS